MCSSDLPSLSLSLSVLCHLLVTTDLAAPTLVSLMFCLSARAEMVKISAALKHFNGMPSRNSRILEDVLEKCRARESHCRASARRQMQTYVLRPLYVASPPPPAPLLSRSC